jgi:hypothetical protein
MGEAAAVLFLVPLGQLGNWLSREGPAFQEHTAICSSSLDSGLHTHQLQQAMTIVPPLHFHGSLSCLR